MTESAASLQAWDRIQIEDLARRYAHGIDERDWEKVDSCFSPDAYVRGQQFAGLYPEYSSRLRRGVESFGVTMHFLGNQLVTLGEDKAAVATYGIAYHLASRTAAGDFVIGVRYLDDVVRAGDGWVIARRVVHGIWRRRYGSEVEVLAPASLPQGRLPIRTPADAGRTWARRQVSRHPIGDMPMSFLDECPAP